MKKKPVKIKPKVKNRFEDDDIELAEDIYGPSIPPNRSFDVLVEIVEVSKGKPSKCDEIGY